MEFAPDRRRRLRDRLNLGIGDPNLLYASGGKCFSGAIHHGLPLDPKEKDLEKLIKRTETAKSATSEIPLVFIHLTINYRTANFINLIPSRDVLKRADKVIR